MIASATERFGKSRSNQVQNDTSEIMKNLWKTAMGYTWSLKGDFKDLINFRKSTFLFWIVIPNYS